MTVVEQHLHAARVLRDAMNALNFAAPTHVTNPLTYAWRPFAAYVQRYGAGRKRVLFLGMNPGPFGMAQTGVPFGEVAAVRDWMGIDEPVDQPARPNPDRPVLGFACPQSEVSGRRLWGMFAQRFGTAAAFFADHYVVNYCPLLFSAGKRNLTPDKFPRAETDPMYAACDAHLRALVQASAPDWVVGVGRFARDRAMKALTGTQVKFGEILHPSPASPAANRGVWADTATAQLQAQGIW